MRQAESITTILPPGLGSRIIFDNVYSKGSRCVKSRSLGSLRKYSLEKATVAQIARVNAMAGGWLGVFDRVDLKIETGN
jgi:hypothetical protein